MTKDISQFWLVGQELDRVIERAQDLSRCARILSCDVVVNGVEIGKRCARGFNSKWH